MADEMTMGAGGSGGGEFLFRAVDPQDQDVIKALHEECFPVRYSEKFFRDACQGRGFRGGAMYTCLCVDKASQRVVGFIFAQIQSESEAEDKSLLGNRAALASPATAIASNSSSSQRRVCYILTLGLETAYRRFGLGTQLLDHCIDHARSDADCGAVYLHVIHNNPTAIAFYKRSAFIHLRTLTNFYIINGESHTALLLILYINNFQRPSWSRLLLTMRTVFDDVVNWLSSLFGLAALEAQPARDDLV